ncbi:MAG: FtsX-like permease family protein [Phycisphaerae bacterium]
MLLAIHRKSLVYHRRTNLAVVLCVFAGTAALTGALLVGDSMRGSLRDLALRRLGPVDQALVAPRFFREALATELGDDVPNRRVCPAILLPGGIHHAESGARVNRITILGVDERFGGLESSGSPRVADPRGRTVVLNRDLAEALDAKVGDAVLLSLPSQGQVPAETVLGRREAGTTALRLTVADIVPADGLGGFSLKPTQSQPNNAWVPLRTLQRALHQADRVNTILVTTAEDADDSEAATQALNAALRRHVALSDYSLRLRRDDARGYFSLESDRLLLEPPVEAAARAAAKAIAAPLSANLTYLANAIAVIEPEGSTSSAREIPYSMITALDVAAAAGLKAAGAEASRSSPLKPNELLLNDWAASDLGAKPGDSIRITYYVSAPSGDLATATADFTLKGIVPPAGWAADPGFMPSYRGITDARNLSDWNPPEGFKIDLARIRPKDEAYWDRYRGTPKAFIALDTGRRLWTRRAARFGTLTSIYFGAAPGQTLPETQTAFEDTLLGRLAPGQLGLRFEPVRDRALAAGAGSTDFSSLFLGFSFFIIIAAALLVALVFRLGVEQRAKEIGILLATGYAPKQVSRGVLLEGAILAGAGALIGLLGAIGYGRLMVAGLRTRWAEAVHTPFLELHVPAASLLIGWAASFAVAMLSIGWSIRGLARMPARALLAGSVASGRPGARPPRGARIIRAIGLSVGLTAIAVPIVSDAVPGAEYAFFIGGTAMLVAGLAWLALWMRRERRKPIRASGSGAVIRLGIRNVARHRGRSLTTAGLIACACYVIIAVGASRREVGRDVLDQDGGTGGYGLVAESTVPLPYALGTAAGRDHLNLENETSRLLRDASVMALRLRPGDDTSCLNLYKVTRPRILGAPPEMIDRGGFRFADSLAETPEERANPWRLLERTFDDGTVPAIGDADSLMWLLKLGLGEDLTITDERGQSRRLRIVGMLSGSIFQGELLIAEDRFTELFPSISGAAFTLIDGPTGVLPALSRALEHDLAEFGFDAQPTTALLDRYLAVQNTYLSAFQTLGGLGLVLGTLGLAAVMLRNVLERRGELALLRALGHRRAVLGWMVLTENAVLLFFGLSIGGLPALLAIFPNAASRPGEIPWVSLAGTLLLVLLVGMAAGAWAVRSALRTPLLPALRRE